MIQIPNKRFTDNIYKWQIETFAAFHSGLYRFYVLEIHRRGRKTSEILNLLIDSCIDHPKTIHAYVGPTYTQAKMIAWDDPNMLFASLPDKNEYKWEKNESALFIRFMNGSMLRILGADKPDSLRGIDAYGVGFDEDALIKENVWTEIFRPMIAQDARRWAAWGYTPKGVNHATRRFDYAACLDEGGTLPINGPAKKMRPGWFALRLLASQSGIISDTELEKARQEMPKLMFDQEFECARVADEEMTLITSAMIDALKSRNWDYSLIPVTREIIACDPSLDGDECPVKVFRNTQEIDQRILHFKDPTKIVAELLNIAVQHGIYNFIVDSIGIGSGVAYGLANLSCEERPLNVQFFNSAVTENVDPRFRNKRAEAWWSVMKLVFDLEVAYPKDDETVRQIPYASRYKMGTSGKVTIRLKSEIKELCGCSPDRAECWMMGQYGLQFVTPKEDENKQTYRERRNRRQEALTAMDC